MNSYIKIASLIFCLLLFQCNEAIELEKKTNHNRMDANQKPLVKQAIYLFYTHIFMLSLYESVMFNSHFKENIKIEEGSITLNFKNKKQAKALADILSSNPFLRGDNNKEGSGWLNSKARLEKQTQPNANGDENRPYFQLQSKQTYGLLKTKYLLLDGIMQSINNPRGDINQSEAGESENRVHTNGFYLSAVGGYEIYFKNQKYVYYYPAHGNAQVPDSEAANTIVMDSMSSEGKIDNQYFSIEITNPTFTFMSDYLPEPLQGQVLVTIGDDQISIDFGNGKRDDLFRISFNDQEPCEAKIGDYYSGILER